MLAVREHPFIRHSLEEYQENILKETSLGTWVYNRPDLSGVSQQTTYNIFIDTAVLHGVFALFLTILFFAQCLYRVL